MKLKLNSTVSYLVLVTFVSSLIACATDDKNADTPEGLYAIAEEYEKNDRYEFAIQRYTEVKNKFPYSAMATRAELAIADVHYKAESWPEAQVSYQSFRDLHPKHPKIDYVTFRIAMSYYNQLPETVDRDLTLARDAISHFAEVVTKYPTSEYAKEAAEKRDDCLKRLAGKEEYIGDFYFNRGMFISALPRYEGILKNYPGLGLDAKALARAAVSASKAEQPDKAKRYISILSQKYPDSDELSKARKEIR